MEQILDHGFFHTSQGIIKGSMHIVDGRIAAIGDPASIHIQVGEGAEHVELAGAHVYPGMVDTHLHILSSAVVRRGLMLDGVSSREQMLQLITERAKALRPGERISARGFNEDLWPDKRLPTLKELDAAAGDHPLFADRVCGHLALINTAAMREYGLTPSTPVPEGSVIDLEHGIVTENAITLINDLLPDRGIDACCEVLLEGLEYAADAGLTGLYSDDFNTDGFRPETVIAAYRRLCREGKMPVRVVEQCMLTGEKDMQAYLSNGHFYGEGDDFFRLGPRKAYADGSLGARTAFLDRPYADQPSTCGSAVCTQEQMNALLAASHRAKLPTIVHCIGNAAVQRVLDAIVYARKAVPGTDNLPDGLVHCQITTPQQLAQIRELGVQVFCQPIFTEYDLHICRARVGETLEQSSYNWRTLYDSGVLLSSGSDHPVEPLSPVKNIYSAVFRRDLAGYPASGWLPQQCLTVAQAIDCHTAKAAEAAGTQDRLGQIRPGFLADLSVFDRPFEGASAEEMLLIRPMMTVVGGRVRPCRS